MIVEPKEWISKPDDDGNSVLSVLMKDGEVEFPIPIEMYNIFPEDIKDIKMNKEQDFEIVLDCADKPTVYKDEEAYIKETDASMHFESVIPIGLFPDSDDESFVRTPHILLNGKVIKIYDNPSQSEFDELYILYSLSCLGNEYDAVIPPDFSDGLKIEEGNIVSCVYRVRGWPNQDYCSEISEELI